MMARFASNQAVWILTDDASWKPGIILDEQTRSLLDHDSNIETSSTTSGHQLVYVFEKKKIEEVTSLKPYLLYRIPFTILNLQGF